MARILIFDDQSVYRTGLRELITANNRCAEVIEASSPNEAFFQIHDSVFDLVLVGTGRALGLDSLELVREASPATRFAIISASNMRTDILDSLAAGFHGFISKWQPDTEILAAIGDILAGRIYVPQSLAETEAGDTLSGHFRGKETPASSIEATILKLTKRQREVLALLARGRSNKEIARALNIAEATTKIHMAALLRTLGVRNRTEAAYKTAKLVELDSVELSPDFNGVAA